uniref:F-box domain-containing protein n=2 Tax=Acrobeloides nanus TaxID=290746 RepID=A0A914ELS9_9BILA
MAKGNITKKRKSVEAEKNEPAAKVRRSRQLKEVLLMPIMPNDVLVRIFSKLDREDLDSCSAVCKQWHNVVEDAEKELSKRPIDIRFDRGTFDSITVTKVNSRKAKAVRIDFASIRKHPDRHIFKNAVVKLMAERLLSSNALEEKIKKICELAGDRIPVENFHLIIAGAMSITEHLEKFKRYFLLYVNTSKLMINMKSSMFDSIIRYDRKWSLLEFGPDVEVEIETDWKFDVEWHGSYIYLFDDEFSYEKKVQNYKRSAIENIQKFFSCSKFNSPSCIQLTITISREQAQEIFSWIIEGFRNAFEPPKFFKKLVLRVNGEASKQKFDRYLGVLEAMLPRNLGVLEEVLPRNGFKFSREEPGANDMPAPIYCLVHTNFRNWALEAKKLNDGLELKLIRIEADENP